MAWKVDFGFTSAFTLVDLTDAKLSAIESAGAIKLDHAERESLAEILQRYQQDYARWATAPLKSQIVKRLESVGEQARSLGRALLELERANSKADDFARSAIFLNLPSIKVTEDMLLRRLKLCDLIEPNPAKGSQQQALISKLKDALDRANEIAANKQPARGLLSSTKRMITIAARSGVLPKELEAQRLWGEWQRVLSWELHVNMLLRLQSPAIALVSHPDWSDHLSQLMSMLGDGTKAALAQLHRRVPNEKGGRPKDIYFSKVIRDLHALFKGAGGRGSYSFTHTSRFTEFVTAAMDCLVGRPKIASLDKAIQRALAGSKHRTKPG